MSWSPEVGETELRPIDGAPPPRDNARLRLVQMRRLAEQFEPHMLGQAGDEVPRLLPQPLYRYSNPSDVVIDGALFGYVFSTTGTDLDFVLLLKCRESASGTGWFYAPARFTRRELWLNHNDEEVWRVAWHEESPRDGAYLKPYVTLPVRSISDADIDRRGQSE